MINGRETKVAVNDMVPASQGRPFFANGKDGARWPALIEKAYAKLFGGYKALEGRFSGDVFKAVMQSPVSGYIHKGISKTDLYLFVAEHGNSENFGAKKRRWKKSVAISLELAG